jgi:hypothetical protein
MRKSMMWTLSAFVVFIAAGCATIIHGSRQSTAISSYPSHATVFIDNQNMGATPLMVRLKRKDNHLVKIELPGYLPYEATFTHKFNAWIFGNLVFGGIIGIVVDAVDGAMYKLSPDQLDAELTQGTASAVKATNGLFLAVVLKADPHWKKVDQLQKLQ